MNQTQDDGAERRGYAICGEPRCGSTYFAACLASTGKLGNPWEYFAGIERVRSANADPEAHLEHWVRHCSTPNGVYGLKMFARQFDLVEQSRWAERLPRLHFVHLTRVDLLAQAISLVRAEQTGAYESKHEPKRPPRYDARRIAAELRRLSANQGRWSAWFARNGIDPLRLTYEDVAADVQRCVDAVAALIGVEGPVPVEPHPMEVQRDEISEEWRRSFVAERRDLAWLDDDPLRLRPMLRRLRSRFW